MKHQSTLPLMARGLVPLVVLRVAASLLPLLLLLPVAAFAQKDRITLGDLKRILDPEADIEVFLRGEGPETNDRYQFPGVAEPLELLKEPKEPLERFKAITYTLTGDFHGNWNAFFAALAANRPARDTYVLDRGNSSPDFYVLNLEIPNNVILTITEGSELYSFGTATNNGTINVTDGSGIYFADADVYYYNPNWWGFGGLNWFDREHTFHNNGTLNVTGTGSEFYNNYYATINNNGTINVTTGGKFYNNNGGTINSNGRIYLAPGWAGWGHVYNDGYFENNGTIDNTNHNFRNDYSGYFGNYGTIAYVSSNRNGMIENFGTVTGSISKSGPGLIRNYGTIGSASNNTDGTTYNYGTINNVYNGKSSYDHTIGTVHNHGTINTVSTNQGMIHNHDTIGTLRSDHGTTNNYGTIGDIVWLGGRLHNYGTITGTIDYYPHAPGVIYQYSRAWFDCGDGSAATQVCSWITDDEWLSVGKRYFIPWPNAGMKRMPQRDGYRFLGWFTEPDGGGDRAGYDVLYGDFEDARKNDYEFAVAFYNGVETPFAEWWGDGCEGGVTMFGSNSRLGDGVTYYAHWEKM